MAQAKIELSFWDQLLAARANDLRIIEQKIEAKKSFKDCSRCHSAKVHQADSNLCLPCSYS